MKRPLRSLTDGLKPARIYCNYHLTVCVVNGEGKIGAEVYSQDISVLPPWYLTIWAKLFYITALIVLISWVVSYYFLHKKLAAEG